MQNFRIFKLRADRGKDSKELRIKNSKESLFAKSLDKESKAAKGQRYISIVS